MDSPDGDRRLAGHPLGGDPSVCMNVNLSIVQPTGYVHSLIFLDVARALRHGLRRIGLNPILSKNRLRSDCTNWILGGHLGFQPALLDRYRCVMVNLEPTDESRVIPFSKHAKFLILKDTPLAAAEASEIP